MQSTASFLILASTPEFFVGRLFTQAADWSAALNAKL